MMKRIQYFQYGSLEELQLDEVKIPKVGQGNILVKVKAASVNPMDWKIRRGEMKPISGFSFPRGLGHDFAGVVEAIGPAVKKINVGDEVFGVTDIKQAGTFAEYTIAKEDYVGMKPASRSFEEAAALSLVSVTAWSALIGMAKLTKNHTIFINGCLGSVGRSAVQIAKIQGARIIGSCSGSGREEALALGVDEVVDYRSFQVTPYRKCFDIVFDTAGALSFKQCKAMLVKKGKSLHIVPTLSKMLISLFSSHHHIVFGKPSRSCLNGLSEAMRKGQIRPKIGRIVSLNEGISAFAELEQTGFPKGKLVIVP